MVVRESPEARDTLDTPPRPRNSASAAAIRRRCLSSRRGKMAAYFSWKSCSLIIDPLLHDTLQKCSSYFLTGPKLDFIHLRGIANRVNEAFKQFARKLYHVSLLLRHGNMTMLPYISPDQGHRIRKGGANFAIPRRASHAGRSLFDQQMRSQRDDRIQAQQGRCRAGNGTIIPLARRFHPQMGSCFLTRHFHGPATDKPGQHRRRGMIEMRRQQGLWVEILLGIS